MLLPPLPIQQQGRLLGLRTLTIPVLVFLLGLLTFMVLRGRGPLAIECNESVASVDECRQGAAIKRIPHYNITIKELN
jgi:hypothetical protein